MSVERVRERMIDKQLIDRINDAIEKATKNTALIEILSQEVAKKNIDIIFSQTPPDNPTEQTFWYEDRGDSPIDFNPSGDGVSVANATVSDDEPSVVNKYDIWFDVE